MPPKELMHNYDIKNMSNYNLKHYLENHNLPVPYHWHDDDMN